MSIPRRSRGASGFRPVRVIQRTVPHMAMIDEPPIQLIDQLGLLTPHRVADRPVLHLGPQTAVRDQIRLRGREQIAAASLQEVHESPNDVGVLPQRLRILVLVHQVPKPRAQRLHRQHRHLIQKHRCAVRDRPASQQAIHLTQVERGIANVPTGQGMVHKGQKHADSSVRQQRRKQIPQRRSRGDSARHHGRVRLRHPQTLKRSRRS